MGKRINGPEHLKEVANGSARIRRDTLGIVGLGMPLMILFKMTKLLIGLSICRSLVHLST